MEIKNFASQRENIKKLSVFAVNNIDKNDKT